MRTVTILILGGLAGCAGSDAPASEGSAPVQSATPAAPVTAATPTAAGSGALAAPSVTPVASNTASITPPSASAVPSVTPPVAAAPAQPAQPAAAMAPPASTAATPTPTPETAAPKLAMDECGLHTKYPGDEYCINPPPADKGFQLHIGPSNYDNPEPEYILQPGEENVVAMDRVSGNTSDVYYYYRQYRMRPGSHHVILNSNGRRLGGTQNLSKDNPDNGIIPPENADVGLPLAAKTTISANMHFYNFGEKPILRELWVNFWYKDPATVKRATTEVWSPTSVNAAVAHSHVVVGASCPVNGDGRLLTLYGHRHMNNVRFSAWRTRGGSKDLILEDYDPMHPEVLEYNSLATNNKPDPASKTAGGWSGILDLKSGDTIDFECEIVNMTSKNFVGANEADDDEMCIITGDAVGTTVPTFCTAAPSRTVN
jgi:hypothetical protein